jgi:septal ring factor EnvC (AmiA/AmiB activator)
MVSRIIQGPEPEALATVFLDHGRGVYSILSGVADLSIEVGNGLVAGAIIGKLPSSVNTDQPSTLIWQSVVNGVYVNPLILTELN